MLPSEYIEAVKKTESINFEDIKFRIANNHFIRLDHAAKGMCTEAGEFLDVLKKYEFYGKELDNVNLKEELGDVLWYIGIACDELGITLEEVMQTNIKKLHKRYGISSNEEGAINRNLSAERVCLEQNDTIVCYDPDCTLGVDFKLGKHLILEHKNFLKNKDESIVYNCVCNDCCGKLVPTINTLCVFCISYGCKKLEISK